ncbi:hypothetical protein ACH4TQ_47275 [Streptomyces sp. NPDC021218]|uniref:hypothetical protein n=1 Tax=Streptomyces sp. NPDC021218 TaxID=3365119 RepID=UPI0037987D8E
MSDGAAALLEKLDLRHNYLSQPVRQRIRTMLEPAGVKVDLDQDDAEWDEDDDGTVQRYVSVAE